MGYGDDSGALFQYNRHMIDKIKDNLLFTLQQVFNITLKADDILVVKSDNREHGDFTINVAFKLAKELEKAPKEIAETLCENLSKTGDYQKVEAVNGYINLFLNHKYYQNVVSEILKQKEHFGDLDVLKGEKIQVEFISANPTGPLTLANGRGGFGGDALANVLIKAGAKVEREYYVNDGGNQVTILGKSILVAAGVLKSEEELYKGEYIETWATDNKENIAKLKDKPFELGQIAAHEILKNHIKPSVKGMGIKFDNWFSEDEMVGRGEVDESITNLTKFGHTFEQDGALWMKTTEFGDDKDRVLVKSDGEKTYFANDIAYHFDKFYKRHFTKVINFWGADHHGYVGRMMAAVSQSVGTVGTLKIVIFQLVHLIKDGQEYKMSKRKGTYITMDDLLTLIGKSNPATGAQGLREASDVARFFFLMRSFNTHMDFDLDLATERSDKNPVFYVKYAYARICSILAKSSLSSLSEAKDPEILRQAQNDKGHGVDLGLLVAPEEIELIDQLSQLPQLVASIITFDDYPVHYLTYFAIETAKRFHQFYDKCRVIDEDNLELTGARLELVRATQIVLGIVMRDLIGIDAPERM